MALFCYCFAEFLFVCLGLFLACLGRAGRANSAGAAHTGESYSGGRFRTEYRSRYQLEIYIVTDIISST